MSTVIDLLEKQLGEKKLHFTQKPILIGGMAMEYYGLRKSGADIDLVICDEDYQALALTDPDNRKDIWGDLGVVIEPFEIWRCIMLLDYDFYIKDAIDALLKLTAAREAKSRIYNISSGNVVVDKMVACVKEIIPGASFSYSPVADIMAVVSGFKEWVIGCSRAEKEIGWRPIYTVDKMVDDIIGQTRS